MNGSPYLTPPPQLYLLFVRPLRKPASDVINLNVDPGGSALIARLTNGSAASFRSASQSFFLMLGINVFGSNDGTDANAKTFPLFGSITTAPARLTARNASSVIAWIRASMVRKTFAPCFGGSSFKTP